MYRVRTTKAAERDLDDSPANVRPRHKCRKPEGDKDFWRVVVGGHRILYVVGDEAQEVCV